MSKFVVSRRFGVASGPLCAVILCSLLTTACSSLTSKQNTAEPQPALGSALYSLDGAFPGQDATDQAELTHIAELQSDFQYLYNKDIADPYQRTLAVSRGHMGMLDAVPPTDTSNDLWQRIRDNFQLDLAFSHPRIEAELSWYIANPLHIERTMERGQRYIHYIVDEIEKRNMPMEFALLPVVESAFEPFAYSHGQAAGLWQFIPSTGKMYGLKQDWWYDGRRDVLASTDAALNYLQTLANQFDGDWLLALASYNAGAGTVRKAIRQNQQRGLPTDFWHLKLPRETSAYVPKLLALAKLVKHPDRYDTALMPLENTPYFEVVNVGSQIDLTQAAELAEIELNELYYLNPAFNRWATSPLGPHHLLVPKHSAEVFRQALAGLPADQRVTWQRYTVQPGDSLIRVARQHNTSVDAIRQVNKLNNNLIRVGQSLMIPSDFNPRLQTASQKSQPTEHIVAKGDTWWDLSRKYGVTVQQLASWNNRSSSDMLRPGQKLVVFEGSKSSVASTKPGNSRKMVRQIGYRVRSGDSLYRIANKFNVSVKDIASWNGLNTRKHLQPGQRLKLYVDIASIN